MGTIIWLPPISESPGLSQVDEDGNRIISTNTTCWFTNIDLKKRHEELILYKTYTPHEYPKYANFDGIEVAKTIDIPVDFDGPMGVPITFLDKYNPDQFEILGSSRTIGAIPMSALAEEGTFTKGGPCFYLANSDGTYRRTYERLVIKNKRL